MTNFKAAIAYILLLSNLVSAQDENCVGIEELGTPNLDRFDYSITMVSRHFVSIIIKKKKVKRLNFSYSSAL